MGRKGGSGFKRSEVCGNYVRSVVDGWYVCACGCGRVAICHACYAEVPARFANRPCQQHLCERVARIVGALAAAERPVTMNGLQIALGCDAVIYDWAVVRLALRTLGVEVVC